MAKSACWRCRSLVDLKLLPDVYATTLNIAQYGEQDACRGVHSACQREENGHNLDICALRRPRLSQGQMQGFLGLKVGGGCLNLQIWGLNRPHETERTVFPILQVFSMCRCKL